MTSPTAPHEIVPQQIHDAFLALGAGNINVLGDLLHDDVVMEFPGRRFGGRFEGKRKVMIFLKRNHRLFEDGLAFAPTWIGRADDRLVAQWTNAGVTKSGIDYANRGVTIFRTVGDRVVEIQDYLDTQRMADTWPETA